MALATAMSATIVVVITQQPKLVRSMLSIGHPGIAPSHCTREHPPMERACPDASREHSLENVQCELMVEVKAPR